MSDVRRHGGEAYFREGSLQGLFECGLVCYRTAYTKRDEAVAAAVHKLIATFEGIRDWKGSAAQNQPALAERMIQILKDHLSWPGS